jgi:hypothetical protein
MIVKIGVNNGGASGSVDAYGPDIGGYAYEYSVDGKAVAVFRNDQWSLFWQFIRGAIRNLAPDTVVEFESQDSWLDDFVWSADDQRKNVAICVQVTPEEFISGRTIVHKDHPIRTQYWGHDLSEEQQTELKIFGDLRPDGY